MRRFFGQRNRGLGLARKESAASDVRRGLKKMLREIGACLMAFRIVFAACCLAFLSPNIIAQVPQVRFTVERFVVEGDNPLDTPTTEALLAPYTGEYEGLSGLVAAQQALDDELTNRGLSFHRAILPPQSLKGGTVRLDIVAIKIDKLIVEGNEYFHDENILTSLPGLQSGQVPRPDYLGREVGVANRHGSKQLRLRFRQGGQPDRVNAVVAVEDKKPWLLFAALNNRGSDQTGDFRVSLGAQHSNLFDRDHQVTGSYTTSPGHLDDVKQIGINYRAPIYPWHGWVSGSFVHSDVDSGRVAQVFDVSGAGTFYSLSFHQDLKRIDSYRHSWRASIDDRRFTNNISLGRIPLGNIVRSRPLSVRYEGLYAINPATRLQFGVGATGNLPGGSHNNDAAYAATRAGAKRSFTVLGFDAQLTHTFLEEWALQATVDGQYAGEPLISGEQLGIGGASSVRGFDERVTSGDNGVVLNVEVWSPKLLRDDGPRAIGFVDFGYRERENAQAGEAKSDSVASAGLGIRWQWREQISLAADWAKVLERAQEGTSERGESKLHFSFSARY